MKVCITTGDHVQNYDIECNKLEDRLARLLTYKRYVESLSAVEKELHQKLMSSCCGFTCDTGEVIRFNKDFNLDKEIEELRFKIDKKKNI